MKRVYLIVIACVSLVELIFGVLSGSITAILASMVFAVLQGVLIGLHFSNENPLAKEISTHIAIVVNLAFVPWLYTFFPMTRANLLFAQIGLGILAFSILLDMILLWFTERTTKYTGTKIPFLIIGLVLVPFVIGFLVYHIIDLTHVSAKTQWFALTLDILVLVLVPLTYAFVLLKNKRFSLFFAHLTFFAMQSVCYIGVMQTNINNLFSSTFSFNPFVICYPFFVISIVCLTYFQRKVSTQKEQWTNPLLNGLR
ncbi:MAG: hypothetical protein IJ194_05895 [Bacilli bacterium]|nr:hypothetical protein [Bacilli bacterium]